MKTVTPFLWFDDQAMEATKFYLSVFKDSKLIDVKRKGKQVFSTTFRLNGQEFIALNGGPHFQFTPAISFFVSCKTQAEIDGYWDKLTQGGSAKPCGWLTDQYGLSWQIVPAALEKLMAKATPKKRDLLWKALMSMTKIEIKTLQATAQTQPKKNKSK